MSLCASRMTVIAAIIVALATAAPTAQARTDTGHDLLFVCRSFEEIAVNQEVFISVPQDPALMECWGYMSAVMDFANFTANGQSMLGVCSRGDRRVSDYIRVFLGYAGKNPDELHQSAALVAIQALKEAFPCE